MGHFDVEEMLDIDEWWEAREDAFILQEQESRREEALELERERRRAEIYESDDGRLYAAVFLCDSEPDLPEEVFETEAGSCEAYDLLRHCEDDTVERPNWYSGGYSEMEYACELNRKPYEKIRSSSRLIADGIPGYDAIDYDNMGEAGLAEFGYGDVFINERLYRIEKPSIACTGPDGKPLQAEEIPKAWKEGRSGCTFHIKAPALCMDEEPVCGVQDLYELRYSVPADLPIARFADGRGIDLKDFPFTAVNIAYLAIEAMEPERSQSKRIDKNASCGMTGLVYDWRRDIGSRVVSAPEREEAI